MLVGTDGVEPAVADPAFIHGNLVAVAEEGGAGFLDLERDLTGIWMACTAIVNTQRLCSAMAGATGFPLFPLRH